MKQPLKVVKKITIALIGFPLLLFGIILIPLPGPGLVVCFVALLILSAEFDWSKTYLDKARREIKNIYNIAKARAGKVEQDEKNFPNNNNF